MRGPCSEQGPLPSCTPEVPYPKRISLDTIPIGDAVLVSIPLTCLLWEANGAVSLAIKYLLLHNPERGDAAQNWVPLSP